MKAIENPVYDGRDFGADCSSCPLQGKIVVPPLINHKALAIIIAERPETTEEIKLEPMTGEFGQLVDRILDRCESDRSEFHFTNVVLCKAPKNLSPADWKTAKKCCRPRLEKELKSVKTKSVIAFGKHALEVTTGKSKITEYMGAPLDGAGLFEGYKILPISMQASFEPHWIPVLATHLSRGVLMARGQLPEWKWPQIEIEGGALTKALIAILRRQTLTAVDIENVSLEPVADPEFKLLNVGLAIRDLAVSVQWDRCTGHQQELITEILADERIPKVMHNGQHDVLGLGRAGLVVNGYVADTIYGASVTSPQLPRRLDILTCIEFPAPRWKTEFRATKDESGQNRFIHADPVERAIYNAKDAWMTLLLWLEQEKKIAAVPGGCAMFATYMRLNEVAIAKRRAGWRVNKTALEDHKKVLGRRMRDARRALAKMANEFKIPFLNKAGELQNFNPNSNDHLTKLFVFALGVRPLKFSEKTEKASWDEKVIIRLAANPEPQVRFAARQLLKYRKNDRYLSHYILSLYRNGKILDRVHATPNPGGTVVGRWSYQDPSLQVIPKPETKELKKKDKDGKPISVVVVPGMRDVYCADEGMYLVEADYSQLQAYILALLSGDTKMIEMLTVCPPGWKKADIHKQTAIMLVELMGGNREALSDDEKDRLRQLCKKARYQWQFGSTPENAWKVLVVEIPDLQVSQLERLWLVMDQTHPQAVKWRKEQKDSAYRKDFVAGPISGRRYYFHGKVEPTKCYNIPVITTEADVVNPAVIRVFDRLDASRGEEMRGQIHDAIVAQGPDKMRLARILKEEMEKPVMLNGVEIKFKVDVKATKEKGGNWGNLQDLEV